MFCVRKGIGIRIDDLALDLVGPASIVSQASSSSSYITLCHRESFAIVKRLDASNEVDVLLDQIGEVD